MQVRGPHELRRAAALRRTQLATIAQVDGATDEPREAAGGATLAIGRIVQRVAADARLGPHLVVAIQRFIGTPPCMHDAVQATRVWYPLPGKPVTDYVSGEYVLLLVVGGTRFAVKFA